jgi:hypothetical protein
VLHFGQHDDSYTKIALSNEDGDKAFSLLQKSLRCLLNIPNWELEIENCCTIIEISNDILLCKFKNLTIFLLNIFCLVCIEYGDCLKDPKDIFASFKLNIKSIINKMKQKYSSNIEQTESIQLDYLNELNESFNSLQKNYNLLLGKFF